MACSPGQLSAESLPFTLTATASGKSLSEILQSPLLVIKHLTVGTKVLRGPKHSGAISKQRKRKFGRSQPFEQLPKRRIVLVEDVPGESGNSAPADYVNVSDAAGQDPPATALDVALPTAAL